MKQFFGVPYLMGIVALLFLGGCGQGNQAAPKQSEPAKAVEVYVLAAASLSDAMKDLVPMYEKTHQNTKLIVTYGSSGTLQKQIEQGAPADVFLSAAKSQMDALTNEGLIDQANTKSLLKNTLVLAVPKQTDTKVKTIEDLNKQDVKKIAIGQPASVPAGAYAKETLTSQGIWTVAEPKLVYAKDVRQVLSYIETGNVDAGFVYRSDALLSSKVEIAATVDPSTHSPILYPVGVVKNSKHPTEAQAVYKWLQAPDTLAVFRKFGFDAAAGTQ